MFKKILEEIDNQNIFKSYTFDGDYLELIKKLKQEYVPKSVWVDEDCDIGFKCVAGYYSFDEFIKDYEHISFLMSKACIHFENNIVLYYYTESEYLILSYPADSTLELEDMFMLE